MNAKRSLVGVSVVAILASVLLVGCGGQASTTTDQAAAKQQFLTARGGGGTPGPASATPGTTGSAGRLPGASGAIETISGNKITIKNQSSGAETVIQLNDGAPVLEQATAQLSDITQGTTVTATGTKNGDTVEAQSVRIGNAGMGANGGFGGGSGFARQGSASGTPVPGANATPGVARSVVSGTVAGVSGDTITVTTSGGSTATFTVSSSTRLQKTVTMQVSDLKTGDNIFAAGQQNGDTFSASSVTVVTGTGFTGAQGSRQAQVGATPTP